MNNVTIKTSDFTPNDLTQVVRIHREQINQGFLSSLGDDVMKLVFANIIDSKHSFLIVAVDPSQKSLCGFLCGTVDVRKLYGNFVFKKFFRAIPIILPKVLTAERMKKILETLIYPLKGDHESLPRAEFLDFALKPEYQGTGLAQQMFYEAINIYNALGIKKFKSVVNEKLIASQRFHEKLGAEKVSCVQIHKGQNSIVYVFDVVSITRNRILSC